MQISALALASDGDLLLGTVYGRIHSLSPERLIWGDLTVGSDGMDVYDLAISPGYAQDQTIYASTSKAGVFVSHDGGRSWQETGFPGRAGGSTDYPRLAISPNYAGDQTLFAASGAGVYRFVGREVRRDGQSRSGEDIAQPFLQLLPFAAGKPVHTSA